MIALVLAAASGLSYGASDFCGALASQKNKATLVTLVAQIVSLGALVIAVAAWSTGTPVRADLAWGALGGLGAALGLVTFYRALAQGPMATAASLTALWGAAIPIVVGLLLRETPGSLALFGIALAVPAAVMVSVGGLSIDQLPTNTTPRERVAGLSGASNTKALAILAGVGFGLFFIALSRTSADGGLYPLVGARVASIAALGVAVGVRREWGRLVAGSAFPIALAGVLDFGANAFYLLALRDGLFTWVAAIASLYPVSTVLLARVFLNERLARAQTVGLALAGAALVMVAVGA